MIRPIVKKPGSDEVRTGRGFSLGELKAANVSVHKAKILHIPIDRRRRSVHEENIAVLKEYVASPEEFIKKTVKPEIPSQKEKPKVPEKIAVTETKEKEEVPVKEEKIKVTNLEGISKKTIEKLLDAGIEYVDEIVGLDPKVLAETTSISVATAKKVLKIAKELLGQS